MKQKIRVVWNEYNRQRLRSIVDYDSQSGFPLYTWVYTAPSYDPTYHLRKKYEVYAICGEEVAFCEPSMVYSAWETPRIYCRSCHERGSIQILMDEIAK